jgi:hypothetical protein
MTETLLKYLNGDVLDDMYVFFFNIKKATY